MKKYKQFQRKRADFEDDLVIVFDENDKIVYKGIEDFEPMKDEDWKYDYKEMYYSLIYEGITYIKICLDI